MIVRFWGTRGSVASAGPGTARYGGNTSCVEVRADDGSRLVLDAGTGIQHLGAVIGDEVGRIDLLLTHLHMDHIQGLGFFAPLFRDGVEVHVWGPPSPVSDLRARITRYLSPPLFPVRLRDLRARVELHDVPDRPFEIGPFRIRAASLIHPGQTLGFRIEADGAVLAYLPDHEPALGARDFPPPAAWTSGHDLARGADLLVHDAQYTDAEREERIGWGHSSVGEALAFARLSGVGRLVLFHHDPSHDDDRVDDLVAAARAAANGLTVDAAAEGAELRVGR